MASLNTRIVLRNDSTANWNASKDAVLLKGEVGVEFLESGKVAIKIGDNEHTWEQLPYFGGAAEEQYFDVVPEGEETHVQAITRVVGDAEIASGDIAIVKETLADKTIHTAYVYNGTAWAAMDGNYSADNVYVAADLTLAGNFDKVGNYEKGETIAAGTSLQSVLSGMLQQELYPTANDVPNAEITASGGSGEVGSSYTLPTATLKITDVGSYEYGDKASGISFAIGSVTLAQGADPDTATHTISNTAIMNKDSTIKLQATDTATLYTDSSKSYTFSGKASYEAGKVPVTNLGNAYAAAQIPAGNVDIADKTVTFSGYRYAFAGGTNVATIDSVVARSMTAKKSSKTSMDSQSEALEFTAAAGATKVFFTYPSTWTGTPYFEMFGLAWAENSNFVAKDNISVADYRGSNEDGTLNGATSYKLYAWELDTPLAAETTKFRVWFK